MNPTSSIGNTQGQVLEHWMASCLAMTKCVSCDDETAPKSPKGDLQSVPT